MKTVDQHGCLRVIIERARALGYQVHVEHSEFGLIRVTNGRRSTRFLYLNNDLNPYVAVRLARNKYMTNALLRQAGISVAKGKRCQTMEDALAAAKEIGYPLVVKPLHGSMGQGVSVGIRSAAALRTAVTMTLSFERVFMVEEQLHGEDLRILVLDGKVLGGIRRDPPVAVGDGRSTLAQLLHAREEARVKKIGAWAEDRELVRDAHFRSMLREQGLTLGNVPPRGKVVRLRRNANLSTGGTAHDVPLEPTWKRIAVHAVRTLGLRLAGVDVLVDQASGRVSILELNETPGMDIHLAPDEGRARDVVTPILKALLHAS